MYSVKNLLDNVNIKITEQKGPVRILEHQRLFTCSPHSAHKAYFMGKMEIKQRQALIELKNSAFCVSAGAMQWMLGDVTMQSNIKGVGDFVGKLFAGAVTKESAIKPVYSGTGFLMLEPTYKHLFLMDIGEWESVTIDDGLFLGCEGTVGMSVTRRKSLSAALAGGEGLFNLQLSGHGIALMESDAPYSNLVLIELHNDVIRIDGNMAVAWSSSLQFDVESASRSLLGSVGSGEGLVNVYRGTGKVLLNVVPPDNYLCPPPPPVG